MTPKTRVLRTIIQVVVAVAIAVPSALALLPIDAGITLWAVGISGALVIIVTAIQNALEDAGVLREIHPGGDEGQVSIEGVLLILILVVLLVVLL